MDNSNNDSRTYWITLPLVHACGVNIIAPHPSSTLIRGWGLGDLDLSVGGCG